MELIAITALALLVFGIIGWPILRTTAPPNADAASDLTLEQEIDRYRVALRADTACRRCGQANPPDARYCYECGRPLAAAERDEFEGTEVA